MRAFVAIRQFALLHSNTVQEIEKLKKQVNALFYDVESLGKEHEDYDNQFEDIYMAIADLSAKNKELNKPRNPIGFDVKKE
jgi:predicted  nucleic acid-binding Zn-ribbon protein